MLTLKPSFVLFIGVLSVLMLGLFGGSVKGQKTYATIATAGPTGTVTGAANAQGASTTTPPSGSTPAFISATGTTGALGGSSVTAYIDLQFASSIPLNTIVFVKISAISIPSTLSSYSGAAYTGTSPVAGSNFYNLTAGDGTRYIAVYATAAFNKVRISVTGGGGGLLGAPAETASMNVFFAFYNTTNTLDCGTSLGTSWSGNGTVSNPQNAIDGNLSTYSSITPSLLLSSVEQSFYFYGPSVTNDEVKATLSIPPSVLSLGLLNNITVNAYNGSSTTAVWTAQLGTLLNLDLLGLFNNGTPITISVKPTLPFDRISINYSAVVGLLVTLNVHEIQRTSASPTFTVQNATICANNTATLVANAPAGNQTNWYNATGTLLATSNSFTTPILTNNTTYYASTVKNGCGSESLRLPAVITVNALPTVNPITGSSTVCAGSTISLANTTTGGVWSSSNTVAATVNSSGVVTGAAAGTTNIIYTVTDGVTGCTNSSALSITVSAPPTTSNAGPDQKLCSPATTTTLAANAPAVGTGSWSYVSGPSGSAFTAPTASNSSVTGLVTGTYQFKWTITNGPCASSSSIVTVSINTTPTIASINSQSVCSGQSINLIALNPPVTNTATGGNYTWSLTQGGAALSSTTVTPSGNTTYWVRYTSNTCYADQSVSVTVVQPDITLGTLPVVCQNITNASIPYTPSICVPTLYSIVWDAPAISSGFINTAYQSLPTDLIPITIPDKTKANPGTYTGTILLKNATGAVTSKIISVTIIPSPSPPSVSLHTNSQY